VATVPTYSRFSKSTVDHFDIIGALCAVNEIGEYPGLLRTGNVMYSFDYVMRSCVNKV
jgi:hypothetical protein